MDKKKIVKFITIIVVIAAVLLIVWYIILNPLIDFNKKEKKLENAGKEYFERNSSLLPEEGEISEVNLRTLLVQKYITDMRTTYGKQSCDAKQSWVKVKRKEGKYTYYTNLECGSMKSTIDNEGPTIKLKGKEEIEIEKGTEFKDPGIENVYDNTDGKIKIDSVTVKGKVNSNEIGKYNITYTAYDTLENKTTIERKVNVVQTLNRTVKKATDEDNIYKGAENNNYIEFSNMLFRIVGLNSDGTVKIVSDEPVGTVNYDDINKWLNDYYYNHLTDKAKEYIVEKEFCSSKVDEKNVKTTKKCDKKTKQNVGILSLKDYNDTLKDDYTYLYPNNVAWTSDYNSNKESWITSKRLIDSSYNYVNYIPINKEYNFALYPSINLKKNIKLTKGDGTKENPYEFSKIKQAKAGEKINTRYSGEYVEYGGIIYRIIGTEGKNTKIISNTNIGDIRVKRSQVGKSIYNPKQKDSIGNYIENDLSKMVKNDIFIKKEIQVPIYKDIATYSGKKTIQKYSVKLSAPNMYEMFSGASGNSSSSYWLINSSKNNDINYHVSENDTIYYDKTTPLKEVGVRITGYLSDEVTIVSGKGTLTKPYILQK